MMCSGYVVSVPVDFGISRSRIRYSHHVLVQLSEGGVAGWGEGVLYRATPHKVARLFADLVRPRIEAQAVFSATGRGTPSWLSELGAHSLCLACAVDMAMLDVRSRGEGRSFGSLLGGPHRQTVPLTEQLFLQDWATAQAELTAMLARGTRRLKIKIGSGPAADLSAIRRIRDMVGGAVEIRVDANRAYTLAEGRDLYRQLGDLGVLALEEPLRCQGFSDLGVLRREVRLPIILDESISHPQALRAAIAAEAIDILNLKLARAGGISLAQPYLDLCREHGVQVAVGCSEELGVGTAAIVHLAAALPELHSMEGLGPLRLGFDVIPEAWIARDGDLQVPAEAGLGVAPTDDWRARLPRSVRCFDLSRGSWRVWPFSTHAHVTQRATNVLWRARRKVMH